MEQEDAKLEELFHRVRKSERSLLFDRTEDTRFIRGIALGSPRLIAEALKLRTKLSEPFGRRERKVELSMLRFVSRAASKLSPFSTLTTTTIASFNHGHDDPSIRFREGEVTEVSLVRVHRAVLEKCWAILIQQPHIQRICFAGLNDTVEELEPSHYRFLKPGRWEEDGLGGFHYVPSAQVKATLSGPLINYLRDRLAPSPVRYPALVSELCGKFGQEAKPQILSLLGKLLSLGFLCLLPPWQTGEARLETALLIALSKTKSSKLKELGRALQRLVSLENSYQTAHNPELASRDLHGALDQVLEIIGELKTEGRAPKLQHSRSTQLFYEDVFVPPKTSDGWGAVEISAATTQRLLRSVDVLSCFSDLFSHRHDLLHTLADFWRRHWPNRTRLPLLELFYAFQPVWKHYLNFDSAHRNVLLTSFNPLQLRQVDHLSQLRNRIYQDTQGLLYDERSGKRLPIEEFTALLSSIPIRYRPILKACAFIQPAETNGELWVLNRLFEGTGRYCSRYSPAMPEPLRSRFIEQLLSRSTIQTNGTEFKILDLLSPQANTNNIHHIQTVKVLEAPGERLGLPANRRVRLSDLQVLIDLRNDTFLIRDATDCPLLPCHLSHMSNLYMPSALRFLSLFGPYEIRQVLPRPQPKPSEGDALEYDRVTIESLVVNRHRWSFTTPNELLPTSTLSEFEYFKQVHDWRTEARIPREAFLYENFGQSTKPQYINFDSPLFVELFRRITSTSNGPLIIEEALPQASNFSVDADGNYRALELQLDGIFLGNSPTTFVERPLTIVRE